MILPIPSDIFTNMKAAKKPHQAVEALRQAIDRRYRRAHLDDRLRAALRVAAETMQQECVDQVGVGGSEWGEGCCCSEMVRRPHAAEIAHRLMGEL